MQAEQQYSNHKRFHPLFHFFGIPLSFMTWVASIVQLFTAFSWTALFAAFGTTALIVAVFLSRFYANQLQDRIIRQEENFRHYLLTGTTLDPRLTIRQIVALRFAGDDEFPALCKKAVKDNLKPDDIKKAVKHWRADAHRV